jgi:DNA repair exonuclease SbcCD ATPase subunit
MSIGNVAQTVILDGNELVLVLGENLDLGGNDSRNGVGKTTIVNALSYALFGRPLVKIKMDNLINKSNLKGMFVSLNFEVDGQGFVIQRGRKPNIFKFYREGQATDDREDDEDGENEAQGENRHTQEEIERTVGFSHDMFKHILALNTYVEPFLSLQSGDQRTIIEQLLGITKLSEKAEILKESIKTVREQITAEEIRIKGIKDSNTVIENNIKKISNLSDNWEIEHQRKINEYTNSLNQLVDLDIDQEIEKHRVKKEVEEIQKEYKSTKKEYDSLIKDINSQKLTLSKLEKNISSSTEKICPVCAQEMNRETHEKVHREYQTQKQDLVAVIEEKQSKANDLFEIIKSLESMIPQMPDTFYDKVSDAYNHKTSVDLITNSLTVELENKNPYIDQVEMLKNDAIQQIDLTDLNNLSKLLSHQEFLLKLLINKDSFIRKDIIDQNISLLNQRLSYYLQEMGLPHQTKFKSDLEVEISLYGRDFDFDNLSRGERTRLILSLSWAFRDVYEGLNDRINLLFVDELLDQGLDTAGVESSLGVLKKMSRDNNRSVFLISHRDELGGRVNNILKIIKEGGFTTVENVNTSAYEPETQTA